MNLKQCKNGHYYDADVEKACPHCNKMSINNSRTMSFIDERNKTVSLEAIKGKEASHTEAVVAENEVSPNRLSNVTPLTDEVNVAMGAQSQNNNLHFAGGQDNKTVSLNKRSMGIEPIVGWLVCIKGADLGQDFTLFAGRNFIGRSSNMTVCLSDNTVSREKHAIVVYDAKKNHFIVQPGNSSELFYLNGDAVLSSQEISAYDILEIGETELMFAPFCSESFKWK